MKLIETVIQKPVSVLMVILGILLIGGISYSRLSLELMPDNASPWLSIEVRYPNMSPYTIEDIIIKPIEENLSEVGGIKNIYSTASEGMANVNIEFLPDIDIKKASVAVRQKIELVRNKLPKEANEPEISRYNPSESPIFILTLKGDDLNRVRNLAENYIKRKLERIEGISNITVSGGKLREIEINIDYSSLKSHSTSIQEISEWIQNSNLDMPLGQIKSFGKDINVSLKGKIDTLTLLKLLPYSKENILFRLEDIAEVKDGNKEEDSIARENGEEKITIYIQKASGANTIEIADEIETTIAKLSIPKEIKMEVSFNNASYIKEALNRVKSSGFAGAVIAMIVIFIFLRTLNNTLIIGLSIPISVFATLSWMYLFNIKLNIMTLSGLVLGIGMLVDNTIVVLDSIKRNPENIASQVKQVMVPMIGSTVSTVIVFFPIVFIDVNTRRMYQDFALVIAFALISSLLTAVFIVPNLALNMKIRTFHIPLKEYFMKKAFLNRIFNYFQKKSLLRKYIRILLKSLQNRGKILLGAGILFILSLFLFPKLGEKSTDFLASNSLSGDIYFPSGTPLDKADKITKEIEEELKKYPFVQKISAKVEKEKAGLNMDIELEKAENRSMEEISSLFNEEFSQFQAATVRFSLKDETAQYNELMFEIIGDDIDSLKKTASETAKKIMEIEGIQTVLYRFKEPRPELQFNLDKSKLSLFGISAEEAANTIKTYMAGSVVTKFVDDERQIDVTLKLKDFYRKNPDFIKELLIPSPQGFFVRFGSIAEMKETSTESKIWRKNKRRMLALSAYYEGESLAKMIRKIQEKLGELKLSEDTAILFGDEYKELKEKQKNVFFAIILSLVLVYMVLASLYESFFLPFIIISTIPLAFIGVIFFMYFFGEPLSLSVYIGLIALVGIVVNNGIVLVHEMKVKKQRLPLSLAIFSTCKSRIRPVMMTMTTTTLSLLPIALDSSPGSSMWSAIAKTIIIGFVSSTILIMIIIPIFFSFNIVSPDPEGKKRAELL
ncbi:MAG TPA: hypothetical protein DHW82_01620 [Spirochaetia bacterium]|nr:hypothetical protein [Spirochaetia bacterium]